MKPINTSIFDFPELITGKYVLLIDEYDAPIAGLLDTEEGRREVSVVRKTLHDFYVQAKAILLNQFAGAAFELSEHLEVNEKRHNEKNRRNRRGAGRAERLCSRKEGVAVQGAG